MLISHLLESKDHILYHVTLTSTVPKIKAHGITHGNPTNFTKASGERYGKFGEIFCMTNKEDAIRWAARWDWEINKQLGSGKVSIVEFTDNPKDWEVDHSDPLSQAANKGKWLKKTDKRIKPDQIKGSFPVTMKVVKSIMQ